MSNPAQPNENASAERPFDTTDRENVKPFQSRVVGTVRATGVVVVVRGRPRALNCRRIETRRLALPRADLRIEFLLRDLTRKM